MVKIIGRELRAQSSGNCDIDPDLVLAVIEASGMTMLSSEQVVRTLGLSMNVYNNYTYGWDDEDDRD